MAKNCLIIVLALILIIMADYKKASCIPALKTDCIMLDTVCKGEIREYRIIKEEGSLYTWWIDGFMSQETGDMIRVQWKELGFHKLEVQQVTNNGCYGEIATSEVHVVDCPQTSNQPTAFTPDGDGLNDRFTPILMQDRDIPITYELKIFNKRGLILFESTKPGEGWDGRYKGVLLQTDSYYYQLKIKYPGSKESQKFIGTIILINRT